MIRRRSGGQSCGNGLLAIIDSVRSRPESGGRRRRSSRSMIRQSATARPLTEMPSPSYKRGSTDGKASLEYQRHYGYLPESPAATAHFGEVAGAGLLQNQLPAHTDLATKPTCALFQRRHVRRRGPRRRSAGIVIDRPRAWGQSSTRSSKSGPINRTFFANRTIVFNAMPPQ